MSPLTQGLNYRSACDTSLPLAGEVITSMVRIRAPKTLLHICRYSVWALHPWVSSHAIINSPLSSDSNVTAGNRCQTAVRESSAPYSRLLPTDTRRRRKMVVYGRFGASRTRLAGCDWREGVECVHVQNR